MSIQITLQVPAFGSLGVMLGSGIIALSGISMLKCLRNLRIILVSIYPHPCAQLLSRLPGSSVHGILQARILEWVTISFSRGSFPSRDRTPISSIAGGFSRSQQGASSSLPTLIFCFGLLFFFNESSYWVWSVWVLLNNNILKYNFVFQIHRYPSFRQLEKIEQYSKISRICYLNFKGGLKFKVQKVKLITLLALLDHVHYRC